MDILRVVLMIAGMILYGRFMSRWDSLRQPIGVPPHLVYNRERLVEVRMTAWRVREAILHSLEAGHLLDNVKSDLEKLRRLEPRIRQAHAVRNALATFSGSVEYGITIVGQAPGQTEIGECCSAVRWDHERLQDTIDKALD